MYYSLLQFWNRMVTSLVSGHKVFMALFIMDVYFTFRFISSSAAYVFIDFHWRSCIIIIIHIFSIEMGNSLVRIFSCLDGNQTGLNLYVPKLYSESSWKKRTAIRQSSNVASALQLLKGNWICSTHRWVLD